MSTYQERSREIVEHYAKFVDTAGYAGIAAALKLGREPERCSKALIKLLERPSGDMFWMFPMTAIAYVENGQLTAEARAAMRDAWRTYYPFRGDTENHWLLYYSSLYLAAQKWKGEPGSRWFTGKSSEENMREAEGWIRHWMNLATTKGQGEYDCTHYLGVYLLPLSYLMAWAEDPKMRERARRMLEWIMADFGSELLNGCFVGAHARTDDAQVLEKWNGVSGTVAWLLYGQGFPQRGYGGYSLYYTLAANYEPPDILRRIVNERAPDVLHKERKRTRTRWRFHQEKHGPVYKTTYLRKDYAVGSDQGGVLQPIQQHSWDVTWALDDPRGIQNTIFSTHPYSSAVDLQTYFTVWPDPFTEAVVRSKPTYDSPDKLLGGSPFEQIFQDQDTVVVLYDIPPGTRFPHINGFFSRDLAEIVEDRGTSPWIFARAANVYLAWYPLAPYRFEPMDNRWTKGSKRLVSESLKNGLILQAASKTEFPSFADFQAAIRKRPVERKLEPKPKVKWPSLRDRVIECEYGVAPRVNGTVVRYEDWKLFESPYLRAEVGSRKLELRFGSETRVIDVGEVL